MFYKWQKEAIKTVEGKSGIISAPTGSGKTLVSYVWSGLIDVYGNMHQPSSKVIFTAPIKALSNERYLELKSKGLNVGLETGDFKKNETATILCCTQEIYTLKYAHIPGQKVIIDEFHYIFNDSERSRAYVDGLRRTSDESDILVMSATFGSPDKIKKYLEKASRRDFALYKTTDRITELRFRKKGIRYKSIHHALVFAFSKKGVMFIADRIAETRPFNRYDAPRLREIASILEVKKIHGNMFRGVGTYFGAMLPKEKLLVEMAFRERIIDVVVGTDALSLGVNLPAETVVFGQMAKYVDGPITKNEFLQMSGRAGRRGYFDIGYVTYIPHSKCENYSYDTGTLYKKMLKRPVEEARITVHPSVGRLLKKEVTVQTEAKVLVSYSLPETKFRDAVMEIEALLRNIREMLSFIKDRSVRTKVTEILAEIWNDEMDVETNIELAMLFAVTPSPEAMEVASLLKKRERNYLQALLKVKRMKNRLPSCYKLRNMHVLDAAVNNIDASVFGFEEKLEQIKQSEVVDIDNSEENFDDYEL